jgi:hypothetical protein
MKAKPTTPRATVASGESLFAAGSLLAEPVHKISPKRKPDRILVQVDNSLLLRRVRRPANRFMARLGIMGTQYE